MFKALQVNTYKKMKNRASFPLP